MEGYQGPNIPMELIFCCGCARQIYFATYYEQAQAGLNVPPFADLFDDGEDDLFGDVSVACSFS